MRAHTYALTGLVGLILASAAAAAVRFESDRSEDGDRQGGMAIASASTTLVQAVRAHTRVWHWGRYWHARQVETSKRLGQNNRRGIREATHRTDV